MDTRRQLKVASLIKEAFTEILSKEGRGIYGKAFVTLTNVKLTSDLLLARFNLSIYNAEDPDAVVERFNEHKYEFKRWLGEKLRHHLRRIPEIEFYKDETLDYVFHMEDVFKKIKEEDRLLAEENLKKQSAPRAKKYAQVKTRKTPKQK